MFYLLIKKKVKEYMTQSETSNVIFILFATSPKKYPVLLRIVFQRR